ncbi:glycine--tRNA ligase subunit beta [Candidatus Lariskella endosymbiont of Hedychridium roseum]|uniref:glycine--tRNA ligase subunit beta n=1 Tax=Candidatus Lariskella endosymbiont of Hedychridium roseum TaxID=3077949 RepID=UPI0030CACB81
MSQLLLELFSEEIPALMQVPAAASLFKSILSDISAITSEKLCGQHFATPRRIGFYIDSIPSKIKRSSKEVRGPRVSAAASAIEGFMIKHGVSSRKSLKTDDEFFYFVEEESIEDAGDILKYIIEANLHKLVWPKSMRWGEHSVRWVRPLHSMLCVLNNEVLPIRYGHISAGNTTRGHRFMADLLIEANAYKEYENRLSAAFVTLQPSNRRNIIEEGLLRIARDHDIELIKDDNLMEEVVGLVEYPVVLLGKIEKKFMSLPKEVLITSLRINQRYFMFSNKDGSLAQFFGIVSNTKFKDDSTVVLGNERVLAARLSDAEFFYSEDSKVNLVDRIEGLKALSFNLQIGSMYMKMESAVKIALKIGEQLKYADSTKIKRAMMLAKTDLLTEMVKEFPELQGVMGYYYAIDNGEDMEVAIAIKEHYKPQGPSDLVPESVLGSIIAIADKIDTLNQMFEHHIKPTGSKDPYALRRAAIGINRIMSERSITIVFDSLDIRDDVINFIRSKG